MRSSAASSTPATTTERRRVLKATEQRATMARPAAQRVTYWSIECCVCECLGPLMSTREDAQKPSAKWGWSFRSISGVYGWVCAMCSRTYDAMRPPATRADCVDEQRPCMRLVCRYHLYDLISRKSPATFELIETCALDVARDNPEGMTLAAVGAILGMGREGTRYVEVPAIKKLRAIPGLDEKFEHALTELEWE